MIDARDTYQAVDVAIPSADTIIEVNSQHVITDIPDRSRLRRGQTPQAFRLGTITEAYRIAWEDPDFVAPDDCKVVLRYLPDVPIYVVEGSDHNIKITEPIDVFIADKLFQIASTAAPSIDPDEYASRLAGKVMVVLGGSYGIGADIAKLARGFGATVFNFSRSATGTDVQDPDAVAAAMASVNGDVGRIDYVVMTAGLLVKNRLTDCTMDEITTGIAVNYLAPVIVARAAQQYLCESQGHLLLFTSSSYTRGRAGYSIYSSAKAAVVNLTQALADEWAADGIRVNVINPERTSTPMRRKAFGDEPEGSLLSSQAVALTSIDVLLSDLTGHVIDVRRVEPDGSSRSRTMLEASQIAAVLTAAATGETEL
jgi:ribitol-5-phosphate 2-dehydrogenase (NADP+) / D-ribitol-5-phosphate cytidylyltransferase